MNSPFTWWRGRVKEAAVGVLESIAEESCVSHAFGPHRLGFQGPRKSRKGSSLEPL